MKQMGKSDWVIDKYTKLCAQGFYGQLIIQFEAGAVTVLRKTETFKPPKLHQKNWEGKNGKRSD